MSWNQTDLAFKILINRVVTDSNKKYYEEFGDNTINVNSNEVWSYSPNFNDPNAAILATIAQQNGTTLSPYVLTEDITVPNQQAWFAGVSFNSRVKNWISPKYGDNYKIRLFDGNNIEIPQTDPSGWFFSYPTGILIFSGSTAGFVKPFKVAGFQYVGTFGAGSGGGGLYLETNFTAQTSVTVSHGWGTKPSVAIIDISGQEFGGTYKYIDNNNVQVTFQQSSTGTIILQSKTGSPVITTDLNGLSDVNISSPATGDVLFFNGSIWQNAPASSVVTKYATTATLTANVATTITHSLLDTDVVVQCYDGNQMFIPVVNIINNNQITVTSSVTRSSARIVVIK